MKLSTFQVNKKQILIDVVCGKIPFTIEIGIGTYPIKVHIEVI